MLNKTFLKILYLWRSPFINLIQNKRMVLPKFITGSQHGTVKILKVFLGGWRFQAIIFVVPFLLRPIDFEHFWRLKRWKLLLMSQFFKTRNVQEIILVHSFAATDLEPNLILFQLRGNLKDCSKNFLINIFFMSSQWWGRNVRSSLGLPVF